MPPPDPPQTPGRAVDLSIRGSGTVSVDHPDAQIDATVEQSGPLGVRLGGLRVQPKSSEAIDLHARTHDLARRLRPGGERLRAVEVDRTLGGGQLRTDPRDLQDGRYFQVDVQSSGEAELQRVRVDPTTGERHREAFDLTRRQLESLVDTLATLPPEEP